ncbi:MAG: 16S rRNA (cytosine(1402)-N(4))-methyltransferase RsmH [Planctomycetes bacterium]|nr:16S rRNA (cytosine(1402)-N(4))-methyltransferase RsmH [Planctomycetota bacterium]
MFSTRSCAGDFRVFLYLFNEIDMSEREIKPSHLPVMPEECLEWLDPQPGETVVDGTLGLGGHSALFAEKVGLEGHIIGLDRDTNAIELARANLEGVQAKTSLLHSAYSEMVQALSRIGVGKVDRVFLDIGVSSMQLDVPERGFSFMRDGPLDMRMNQSAGETAADLVATLSEEELANIIYRYGEEKYSRRIAKSIVAARGSESINTTARLAEIVEQAVPRRGRIHPATRVFQALRIAVNDELGELERGMGAAISLLRPGGRLAILTFHSLEDRIAKNIMRGWLADGVATLPKRKVIKPKYEECKVNPRARSAKLRVAEKI